tara:strand:- start:530 stop:886 length:357 start_codon:yes stop_codon:yes gene_type:complete
MTTTYAAVQMVANGQSYVFSVDATDGTEATMVNLVSNRGLGDTFSGGATITAIGPVTLNSSGAAGASSSILGAVIVDPQNNVVAQIPWVDPETAPIKSQEMCRIPVGLNYKMTILTAN